MERHRPGPLKQQNKRHNSGKHRTKGQLEKAHKGKTDIVQASRRDKLALSKKARRNRANQIRRTKREEILSKKRSIGGERSPPHYVTVIALSETCCVEDFLKLLTSCDDQTIVKTSEEGTIHVSYPRLKQRLAFVTPDTGNLSSVLECVRACDSVLFLWPLTPTLDDISERLYSCLYAQGLPATAHAAMGIRGIPVKKQGELRKVLSREIEDRFTEGKIHLADTETDALNLVRFITNQKLKTRNSSQLHPFLLAEQLSFTPTSESGTHGTLKVTGFLRGRALSVNRLIYVPGFGNFQMNEITAPSDPYPLVSKPVKDGSDVAMDDSEPALLAKSDSNRQESLDSENTVDPLEGEQTWPTDEELAESAAQAAMASERKVVKVPKGTSSYQAAWIEDAPIVDSDYDDGDTSSVDNGFDDDMMMEDNDGGASTDSDGDMEDIDTDSVAPSVTWADDAKYDQMYNADQEKEALDKYREERENEMFPDEVDTPEDMPARLRFARYRGLKSFRTSPWDAKENLPSDYARIFQFENFNRFRKHVLREELSDGIVPGCYITVELNNIPAEVYEIYGKRRACRLLLVGLLPHEQKMSLLNFVVRRHHLYSEPVKSKERLIVQCGFRRFACNPIFSDHTNIDKHKYERFLPQSGVCVLSTYAPIMFPSAPVLIFKESSAGHDLVASGSLLSVDPDRLVIKRAVLSGHPYKINKRSAVIRYMFYSREDIEWFKPIELKTKWGRRGHIKEPLGTHGHMKCVFDSQLRSQDTPLLMLYKRMFPKWTYDENVLPCDLTEQADDVADAETMEELFDC